MAKSVIGRILLILLLLCSQGRSACFDQAGDTYFCAPTVFSSEDHPTDPCQCPCEGEECEEQELRLDPVLGESIKIPSEPCSILPSVSLDCFDFGSGCLSGFLTSEKSAIVDDPDPALHLRRTLLAGVVLRL